jgi:hypothetical protein
MEEERYGSDWTDEQRVPEDVFLDFLKKRFENSADTSRVAEASWEEDIQQWASNPIRIEIEDQNVFAEQYVFLQRPLPF